MMPPMAYGDPSPVWPLPLDAPPRVIRESRQFMTTRVDKKTGKLRWHIAVDLGSEKGRPVLAPESGTVVALQTFYGPGAHALLLAADTTGVVLLLGELDPNTWQVAEGEHVEKGRWVGNVGSTGHLHFGAFAKGTRKTVQWFVGDPPPPEVLDPTDYVDRMIASGRGDGATWHQNSGGSSSGGATWHPPPPPSSTADGGGLVALLLLGAAAWAWGDA